MVNKDTEDTETHQDDPPDKFALFLSKLDWEVA